jgi:hypothetical protein
VIASLFQDSTADALITKAQRQDTSGQFFAIDMSYEMVAGTTSATTFKVRIGGAASGTLTLNGLGGSRFYGGVANSYIKVTEVLQ